MRVVLLVAAAFLVSSSSGGSSAVNVDSIAQDAAASTFGVIFDCGSSGTRAHIYYWGLDGNVLEFTPASKADQDQLKDNTMGISDFVHNPAGAEPYITSLMVQVKRWVPAEKQSATRVRALATAGMRLLDDAQQTPIWQNVDKALLASGLAFQPGGASAMTIAGEYEGLFNLFALRQMLGLPAGTPASAIGGLDLGGASTQITFAPPSNVILNEAYRVTVNGSAMRLYSHSYMRSGQSEAVQRYAQRLSDADGSGASFATLDSPCHNVGYNQTFEVTCGSAPSSCQRMLIGTGDHTTCKVLTKALLNLQNECLLTPCAANGVYQPPVHTATTFYAVSAFFYVAHDVGLISSDEVKGISTDQLDVGGATFCAKPWSVVGAPLRTATCFTSAYIVALLDAYGMPKADTTQVMYARQINGYGASWALGAQLYFNSECTVDGSGPGGGGGPPPPPSPSCAEVAAAEVRGYQIGLGLGLPLACALGACAAYAMMSRAAGAGRTPKLPGGVMFYDEGASGNDQNMLVTLPPPPAVRASGSEGGSTSIQQVEARAADGAI